MARTAEVTEEEAIAQDAVEFHLSFRKRRGGPVLGSSGLALQYVDLEVFAVDDLVLAVAVQVMDLERHVVGQMIFPGIGFSQLPESLALEGHGRQAAYLTVLILGAVMEHLTDQDVLDAVAVEIAEAQVASDAEALGTHPLPQHQLGIGGLETCFLLLRSRFARQDPSLFRMTRRHAHRSVACRPVRHESNLTLVEGIVPSP